MRDARPRPAPAGDGAMPGEHDEGDGVGGDVDGVRAREPERADEHAADRRSGHHPERAVRRLQRERGRPQLVVERAAAAASATPGS